MKPTSTTTVPLLDRLPDESPWLNVAGEFALLATLSIVLVVFYVESFQVREDAAFVPRLVMYATGLFLVVGFASVYRNRNRWEEFTEPTAEFLQDVPEQEAKYKAFELGTALREFSWSVLYVIGMLFIGFFTTNFLFTAAYVFYRSEKPTNHRLIEAVLSAIALCIGAYLLFIYVLGNYVIFRLGVFI